jgi:hypothetical protein
MTAIKTVTTADDLKETLERVQIEPEVIYCFRGIQEEPEMLNAIADSKEDPIVSAKLSMGLAKAKNSTDVAKAIADANTEARSRKSGGLPVLKQMYKDQAKVEVIKIKNDIESRR